MDSGVKQQPQESQQDQPQVHCATCGKRFRYKPELAGRTVKCPCGAAILVPRPRPTVVEDGDEPDKEYDFADPEPVRPAKTAAALIAAPAPVGLAAPAGAADAPLDGALAAPVPSGPVLRVDLPPQRKGLTPEERKTNEDFAPPSTIRDFVIPSILIGAGVVLRFLEVMAPWATQNPVTFGPGLAAVLTNLALSVGLMLGGAFLMVSVMEICFLGSLPRTVYKLIAIGVGPGALYGILSFMVGEPYGGMAGTFASVAVFVLLFWLLMRLDLKDASMCVILTWILITAANYAAYKAQGLIQDAPF
jgi:DNA-directed RNA polymerase subunit RPC12/RpoP